MSGASSRTRSALVVVVTVGAIANVVGNLVLPSAWYVPANLALAATVVAIAAWGGATRSDLGLDRHDAPRGLAVGALAALAVGAVIAVAIAVPAMRSFFESDLVDDAGTAERWYDVLVRIPLGTAVYEELLFRSALFGLLLRVHGTRAAVVWSTALFGVWHIVPAWETADAGGWALAGTIVGTVLVTAVGALLFAWLRLRSDSVVAPILGHTATNSFAYVAAWIA